jgi:hypothetical protein
MAFLLISSQEVSYLGTSQFCRYKTKGYRPNCIFYRNTQSLLWFFSRNKKPCLKKHGFLFLVTAKGFELTNTKNKITTLITVYI